MSELILLGEDQNIYEEYIKKYIKNNNILAMSFPDDVEAKLRTNHELNIASLHESIRLSRVRSNPRKTITEHFEVFGRIMMMLEKEKFDFELSNIYAEKSKILTLPEVQRKGKLSVDPSVNHVNTIVGRIDITKFSTDERNLSIGIGYNDKGINVCFGTNITVCSNMSLFGGHYLSSYGKDKVSLIELFNRVEDFIKDATMIDESNNRYLDLMKEITLNRDQVKMVMGDMKLRAVGQAYFKQDAPLDISKTSAFATKYLEYVQENKTDDITVYDLYNIGTSLLSHQSNTSTMWADINNFGEYMVNEFLTDK